MSVRLSLSCSLIVTLFACGSSTTSPSDQSASGAPSTSATVKASAADVSRCKASCDKMKFFNCSTASEQARCYEDCGQATSSQIEVFTGCADSSSCDSECRLDIVAASGGSTCQAGCDKLVACGLVKTSDAAACRDLCAKNASQTQIDCVAASACSAIKTGCGDLGSVESSRPGGG